MSQSTSELQEKFIEWLLLPEYKRGDIHSEAEWGRRMGVTDRTLRRWKTLPKFNEMLEAAREGQPTLDPAAPVGVAEVVEGSAQSDEADYLVVKSVLVAGAKQGNPKSLELYLKTYGKPFVEEEVASRATDLAGMDLDELVAKALAVVSTDVLVDVLRQKGWSVEATNGDRVARA